jgi:hypothetical protein
MAIEHESPRVQAAGERIAEALAELENVVGPNYRCSFVGRCTNPEIPDADIVVTCDDLAEIRDVLQRRIEAGQS